MTAPILTFTDATGPSDAPLLILGPSLGTSTALWSTTTPLLAERYRTIEWDLPGHGASPIANSPFTVADLADAVAAEVRELGAEPILYAGVSLCGAVGVELAVRHPELVEAALIIASGAKIGDPTGWRERAALVRSASTTALVEGSIQRWFAPDSTRRDPELTAQLLQALRDADDESYARCCEALATYDARSDAIKCWSDLWIDGTNYVEVTLNGREYTSDGASIEINQFWFDERYNSPTQYRSSDEAGLVRRVT